MSQPWPQLKIWLQQEEAEPVSRFLEEEQALAITFQDAEDDPILEPELNTMPLWKTLCLTALFPQGSDAQPVMKKLQENFPNVTAELSLLPDQLWEQAWLAYFEPVCFGKKLWICPSSLPIPEPTQPTVILDPGLAFGTGTHPTTALCLEWLAEYFMPQQTVIDYGCGSGILSLAAAKLGATTIMAIDHDIQALKATMNNREQNQIAEQQLRVMFPEEFKQTNPAPVDLLMANILAKPLCELAATFAHLVKEHGKILLSGILTEQYAELRTAYEPYFVFTTHKTREDWLCIEGSRYFP